MERGFQHLTCAICREAMSPKDRYGILNQEAHLLCIPPLYHNLMEP
jgi:hypothetical protein